MTIGQTAESLHYLKVMGLSDDEAAKFLSNIEADVDLSKLATREQFTDLKEQVNKLDNRLWIFFVTMVVMILGLYAAIFFKH